MPEHNKDKDRKKLTRQEWKKKYDSDTAYFANFLTKIDTTTNKDIKSIILEEAKKVGVDPNFLYSTLMAEGLDVYLENEHGYDRSYDPFPIDGPNDLGLDTIGNVKDQLFRKGYLDRVEYNNNARERTFQNEKGENVLSAKFKDLSYGVRATAAFIKNSNDKFNSYLGRKDIKLSNEQKLYFQNVAYNAGSDNANKMVTSYKTRGYLKDNNFIRTAPNESWKEIRKNVGRRYGAMIGLDEQDELKFNKPLREPREKQKPVNVFGTPFINEFKNPEIMGNIKKHGGVIDKSKPLRKPNKAKFKKEETKEFWTGVKNTLVSGVRHDVMTGLPYTSNDIKALEFKDKFSEHMGSDALKTTDYYKDLEEFNKGKRKGRMNFVSKQLNKELAETQEVPQAIYGALISAGVGIASSLIGNAQEKKLQEEQRLRQVAVMTAGKENQDAQLLGNFDTQGVGLDSFYQKDGGKISSVNVDGGQLVPLSSDVKEAVGPDHSQGGIDLFDGQEKVANIEGKEALKEEVNETKVYSDKLTPFNNTKTFAELVKALSKKKGKMEKELSDRKLPKITEDTYKRQIASLDRQEDALFDEQEALKAIKGIENPTTNDGVPKQGGGGVTGRGHSRVDENDENIVATEKGSDFDFGANVVPYLDNVVNIVDTLTKPKVPDPVYAPIPSFNTKVNVNDQLSNVNNATQQAREFIKGSTSNSNVARGNVIGVNLKGAEQKNTILANRENQERNLENQASQVQSRYAFANANIANKNLETVLDRQLATRKEITANVANAVDDYGGKRIYDDTLELANRKLDVNAETARVLGGADDNFKARSDIKRFIADNKNEPEKIVEFLRGIRSKRKFDLFTEGFIDTELKKYE